MRKQLSRDACVDWVQKQIYPRRQERQTASTCFNDGDESMAEPVEPVEPSPAPKLTLTETNTFTLCTMVTCYLDKFSLTQPELEDKVGCECVVMAETQTAKRSIKSKAISTFYVHFANSFVNASAWDLYDTYAQVGGEEGLGIKEFQLLIDTALKSRGVIQAQMGAGSEWTKLPAEEQMRRLVGMDHFQYSVLALERILASHTYKQKHVIYMTCSSATEPNLQLALLWTYDNHSSESNSRPNPVTCLDWNPLNPMLLAVGYERVVDEGGIVCLWSPKNPSHPERTFRMDSAVTSLSFSKTRPNILAASCRSGGIYMIDVANTRITPLSRGELPERFGPIWKISFVTNGANEELISIGHAGVLTRYSIYSTIQSAQELIDLKYTLMMDNKQSAGVTFTCKMLSGLWLSLVPQHGLCYISTNEGVVVKCRVVAPCGIEEVIRAHVGSVFVIAHSPACTHIFFTCGADGKLNIWIDGIHTPLMSLTLPGGGQMQYAAWSPLHPTIICCITNNEMHMWDIARSCRDPLTTIRMRTRQQCYSLLSFSQDGTRVVVGDVFGRVREYEVRCVARPPHLKVEALTKSIVNVLSTYPNTRLLQQFTKLVNLSPDIFSTNVNL